MSDLVGLTLLLPTKMHYYYYKIKVYLSYYQTDMVVKGLYFIFIIFNIPDGPKMQ